MKRLFIVFIVFSIFLANCQKKEEPKSRPPDLAAQNRIIQLQQSVGQDPKNLNAWIELGNILMDTSRFQEAIGAYQKVLELDQKNVNVRVDMGTCYRRIGRSDIAAEEYRKALSIDPNHANAHRNLGVVLAFDLGKKEEAIRELGDYLRLSPNAPDAPQIRSLIEKLKA